MTHKIVTSASRNLLVLSHQARAWLRHLFAPSEECSAYTQPDTGSTLTDRGCPNLWYWVNVSRGNSQVRGRAQAYPPELLFLLGLVHSDTRKADAFELCMGAPVPFELCDIVVELLSTLSLPPFLPRAYVVCKISHAATATRFSQPIARG